MRGMSRRVVLALALAVACAASVAHAAEEERPGGTTKGLHLLGRSLQVGMRVSIKGVIQPDGVLRADEIEIQESSDRDDELQGHLAALDPGKRTFSLLGRTVRVRSKTEILLESNELAAFEDLVEGMRVKVDGESDDQGRLKADKIRIYRSQAKRERVKVEGLVQALEPSLTGVALIELAGVEAVVTHGSDLIGTRGESLPVARRLGGLADDEELLFTGRNRLGRHVAVAGELRLRAQSLSNLDLDDSTEDQLLVPEIAAQVGLIARLGPAYGYVTLVGAREFVIRSEDPFVEGDATGRIGELYFQIPLFGRTTLAVGRQRINDEREWYYNTRNLDALKLFTETRRATITASVSRDLFDGSNNLRDQDLRNFIVQGNYQLTRTLGLGGYFIDRQDRTELDDSPRTIGVRFIGSPGRHFELWLDAAYQNGTYCSQIKPLEVEDDVFELRDTGRRCSRIDNPTGFNVRDIDAFAFDAGLVVRPRWRLDPTLIVGYATASGEDDEIRSVDPAVAANKPSSSFRQTGLHRNRWRFNGVVSFRYYGEVMDPELFNLRVLTVGVGLRPSRGASIDLFYHHFRQDQASKSFHEFEIDDTPSGDDPNLGDEFDIALGYEPSPKYEVRLTAGIFRPGPALEDSGPATAVRFQTKFRF
jgi:alginate production protein